MRVVSEVSVSQEAVERFLGRLITDGRFLRLAADSMEAACLQEGYSLSPAELRLLSGLDLRSIAELAERLDPGLCRADSSPASRH
jgi:hypothetical protein